MLRHCRGGAALAASALVGLLAACGGGTNAAGGGSSGVPSSSGVVQAVVPGVTASTITIGSHQPLTGVLAPGYAEVAPAAKAYFDFVNAHGGVNGRKIDYRYSDDQSSPIRAKSIVSGFLGAGDVFATFNALITADHEAVADDLTAAGMPDLFVGGGCGCWNAPTTAPSRFGFQPDVTAEGKVLATTMMARYPGVPIGVLYQNDAYGQAGLAGVRAVVPPSLLVDAESYSTTNGSLVAQVGALRAKQAGIVISFSVPVFTSELLLTAANLSFHPKIAVSSGGSEPAAVAGEVAKQTEHEAVAGTVTVLDGVITDSFLPAPEDVANPWIALFRSVHAADKTISSQPFDGNTVYGMAVAQTFVEALRAAGPALTRASLVRALQAATLSTTGPALTPAVLSASNHGGFTGMRVGVIRSGSLVLDGPVLTTDAGSGPITPVAAPVPAVPSYLTGPSPSSSS